VAHYDHPKYKHKVLVLIGYNRMRRAVTVRSKRRVPAYMLLAPSRGQQLSNLIQMMGRVAGRSKARLLKNKYTGQKVTVLMYQVGAGIAATNACVVTVTLTHSGSS
jgi:hypothetical protein